MKKLIIIFLFTPFISKSQECPRYDKVVSFSGGFPFNANVEFGFQSEPFGIFAGVKGTVSTKKGTENYPASQNFNLNPYLRGTVKIFGSDDDMVRVYGTGYFGTGKIFGAGIKTGIILSDDVMIFSQAEYTEQKIQVNAGISLRL